MSASSNRPRPASQPRASGGARTPESASATQSSTASCQPPSGLDLDDLLLRDLVGTRPALLLDGAGSIAAITEKGASLLGKTRDCLLGRPFGGWVPAVESTHLELIRVADGHVETTLVRARRLLPVSNDPYVAVLLEEVPYGDAQPLSEAMSHVITGSAAALTSPRLELHLGPWPDVRVTPQVRRTLGAWLNFVTGIAGETEAELLIHSAREGEGWFLTEFRLRQFEPDHSNCADEAAELQARRQLEDAGGDVRIEYSYPFISVDLRLPVARQAAFRTFTASA